jgi:hypothetical protein
MVNFTFFAEAAKRREAACLSRIRTWINRRRIRRESEVETVGGIRI